MFFHYFLEQIFERVTRLAVLGVVVGALVNNRARLARKLGGVVRAVVRNYVHVEKIARVVRFEYTFYRIGNNVRFVPRGYDNAEPMLRFGFGISFRLDEKQ